MDDQNLVARASVNIIDNVHNVIVLLNFDHTHKQYPHYAQSALYPVKPVYYAGYICV